MPRRAGDAERQRSETSTGGLLTPRQLLEGAIEVIEEELSRDGACKGPDSGLAAPRPSPGLNGLRIQFAQQTLGLSAFGRRSQEIRSRPRRVVRAYRNPGAAVQPAGPLVPTDVPTGCWSPFELGLWP
jgi:hypothetical protein